MASSNIQKYSNHASSPSRLREYSTAIKHFFGIEEKTRILIEGGDQDDWWTHFIEKDKIAVPEDVTRIKISNYSLDLVARVNDQGTLERVEQTSTPEITFNYRYNIARGIQRPCTVIVEDGRIYHDTTLQDGINNDRLVSLLQSLSSPSTRAEFFQEYYNPKQLTE